MHTHSATAIPHPHAASMQHDEVIWQVINQTFCSFKVKTTTTTFCKHPQNVTGLCNRSSCPLANSRYATIMEHDGQCYLYTKTIERAHQPNRMWEKRKLPAKYSDALTLIDRELAYWPNFLIHKCKQRLTKIHQYLIRMRRLSLTSRTKLVTVNRKVEKRETVREAKAEKAARITNAISAELIARLQAGTYEGSGMYVPAEVWDKALDKVGQGDEEGQMVGEDEEKDEGAEAAEAAEAGGDEEEEGGVFEDEVEFVEDFEDDDDMEELDEQLMEQLKETEDNSQEEEEEDEAEEEAEVEAEQDVQVGRGKRQSAGVASRRPVDGASGSRKRAALEIEYEVERETVRVRH